MRVKKETTIGVARSNLGSNRVGPRARNGEWKGERTERRAQTAEGLLLHRQQQVSARATTGRIDVSNRIPRHRRIFWRLKIAGYRYGRPRVFRRATGAPRALLPFFGLARCAPTWSRPFCSHLKIEINGTPPSGSLLFPKRSKSITARSAMLHFGFVSVACRCIKKRGVSARFRPAYTPGPGCMPRRIQIIIHTGTEPRIFCRFARW